VRGGDRRWLKRNTRKKRLATRDDDNDDDDNNNNNNVNFLIIFRDTKKVEQYNSISSIYIK
jgi:hypothetical protein